MRPVSFLELAEYPPGTIFSLVTGSTVAGLWSKGETTDHAVPGLASGNLSFVATSLASGQTLTYRQPIRVTPGPDDDRKGFSVHEPPDLGRLLDAVTVSISLFDWEG